MPPDRTSTSSTSRPRTTQFKPVRPSASSSSTAAARASSSSRHAAAPPPAAAEVEEADPAPTIPPKLLTKLLHEFFEDDATRISRDATAAVGCYMETFVKEALARAAIERAEATAKDRRGGIGARVGEEVLEVEDLEKLAPQLLLDF